MLQGLRRGISSWTERLSWRKSSASEFFSSFIWAIQLISHRNWGTLDNSRHVISQSEFVISFSLYVLALLDILSHQDKEKSKEKLPDNVEDCEECGKECRIKPGYDIYDFPVPVSIKAMALAR